MVSLTTGTNGVKSNFFTKICRISPRVNLFYQDFFDFTKSPPISPSENFGWRYLGEITWWNRSFGETQNLFVKIWIKWWWKIIWWRTSSFWWMRNLNNKFHQLNTVSRSVVRTKKTYSSSIIPRISLPLSAWNNESKCLKEHHHGWKSKIMTDSIRSKLKVNGHYISKIYDHFD